MTTTSPSTQAAAWSSNTNSMNMEELLALHEELRANPNQVRDAAWPVADWQRRIPVRSRIVRLEIAAIESKAAALEADYVAEHGHRSPRMVQGEENGSYVGFDGERHPTYQTPTNAANDSGTPLVIGDTYYHCYSGGSGYYQTEYRYDGQRWEFVRDSSPWQMNV